MSHSAPLGLITTISPSDEFIAGLLKHFHNKVIESKTRNKNTGEEKSRSKSFWWLVAYA